MDPFFFKQTIVTLTTSNARNKLKGTLNATLCTILSEVSPSVSLRGSIYFDHYNGLWQSTFLHPCWVFHLFFVMFFSDLFGRVVLRNVLTIPYSPLRESLTLSRSPLGSLTALWPPQMRWMKRQSTYRADYMDMWTTHPYVIIEHVILTPCSLMCCSNSFHSSGFSLTAEICSHSATRASVSSSTDAGWSGLAHSRCSSSSQRCWMERSSGQSSCSTPNWEIHFLWSSLCCTKLEKVIVSDITVCCRIKVFLQTKSEDGSFHIHFWFC